MKKTREELRQGLKKESEMAIEEILDWYEAHEAPNMSQIETHVLEMRAKLGQGIAQQLIQAQEARQLSVAPPCPKCQQTMRYKGMKSKGVKGLIGEVSLERSHYHCPECEDGFFPPG